MARQVTRPPASPSQGSHLRLPVVESWAEWGEVFTDLAWWEPAVREICARASIPAHEVETGYPGTNAVFLVRDAKGRASHVVKIYAPFCHEDYHLEHRLHPLIGHYAPQIGAPQLVAHGILEAERMWPYVILTFVSGQSIREVRDAISPAHLTDVAHDLGARIRRLHALPLDPLRDVAALAPDWQRYVARQTDRIVNQLRNKRRGRAPGADSGGGGKKRSAQRLLSEATLREIPAFITSEMAKVSNAELVLVNGDLTEDHVLLARTGHAWTISGIIDFADARLAPRAYEWPALWFSALDRNDLALHTLMASYDPDLILDGDFFRRAMAFTFLHEFGALIIEAILEDLDAPQVTSLAHLQALLWGPK